jgi:hypothetical protein
MEVNAFIELIYIAGEQMFGRGGKWSRRSTFFEVEDIVEYGQLCASLPLEGLLVETPRTERNVLRGAPTKGSEMAPRENESAAWDIPDEILERIGLAAEGGGVGGHGLDVYNRDLPEARNLT